MSKNRFPIKPLDSEEQLKIGRLYAAASHEAADLLRLDNKGIINALNCAYISERFFSRSASWFSQRINHHTVNGKQASFTPEELETLRHGLARMAHDIEELAAKIEVPRKMLEPAECCRMFEQQLTEVLRAFIASGAKAAHYFLRIDRSTMNIEVVNSAGLRSGRFNNFFIEPFIINSQPDREAVEALAATFFNTSI